jgi:anti-sigma factor RsiW
MNCETWQRQILLSESGELSPEETTHLSRHLATCADCRTFASDSRTIQDAARLAPPRHAAPAQTLHNIRKNAGRHAGRGIRLTWPSPSFWAACAATLMITATTWIVINGNRAQPESGVVSVDHLHALAAGLSSETIETDSPEGTSLATDEERLRQLGMQLLHMEGFATEDSIEISAEHEPLSPTVLLPHRTHAFPPRRYG